MLALTLLLQAVAQQPDISIHATLDAQSVKIEKSGEARMSVSALPEGGSTATSSGTRTSRHFEVRIDARIGDVLAPSLDATESGPQR